MPALTRSGRSTTGRSTRSKQTTKAAKTAKAGASKRTTKAAKSAGRPKKKTKAAKSTANSIANPYAKTAATTKPKTSRRVNAPKKADIAALLATVSGPPMAPTDVSEDAIAASLALVNETNKANPNEIKYAGVTNNSAAHTSKCIKMIESLSAVVVSRPSKFGAGMTALVSTVIGPMPKIFVALGGKKTPDKVKLASAVLWAFVEQQRNTRYVASFRVFFVSFIVSTSLSLDLPPLFISLNTRVFTYRIRTYLGWWQPLPVPPA